MFNNSRIRFTGLLSLLIVLTTIMAIVSGCAGPKPLFDIVPKIEFVGFKPETLRDTLTGTDHFQIVFNYTDGDGDIGYSDGDLQDPSIPDSIKQGVYILALRKDESCLVDTISLNYVFPILKPDEEVLSPSIQGQVTVNCDFDMPLCNPDNASEDVFFQIYIKDNARNKSNVLETPALKVIRAF